MNGVDWCVVVGSCFKGECSGRWRGRIAKGRIVSGVCVYVCACVKVSVDSELNVI